MTDDVEAGDAWRNKCSDDSYSVCSDHGEGEVFDHDNIHLDEKVRTREAMRLEAAKV